MFDASKYTRWIKSFFATAAPGASPAATPRQEAMATGGAVDKFLFQLATPGHLRNPVDIVVKAGKLKRRLQDAAPTVEARRELFRSALNRRKEREVERLIERLGDGRTLTAALGSAAAYDQLGAMEGDVAPGQSAQLLREIKASVRQHAIDKAVTPYVGEAQHLLRSLLDGVRDLPSSKRQEMRDGPAGAPAKRTGAEAALVSRIVHLGEKLQGRRQSHADFSKPDALEYLRKFCVNLDPAALETACQWLSSSEAGQALEQQLRKLKTDRRVAFTAGSPAHLSMAEILDTMTVVAGRNAFLSAMSSLRQHLPDARAIATAEAIIADMLGHLGSEILKPQPQAAAEALVEAWINDPVISPCIERIVNTPPIRAAFMRLFQAGNIEIPSGFTFLLDTLEARPPRSMEVDSGALFRDWIAAFRRLPAHHDSHASEHAKALSQAMVAQVFARQDTAVVMRACGNRDLFTLLKTVQAAVLEAPPALLEEAQKRFDLAMGAAQPDRSSDLVRLGADPDHDLYQKYRQERLAKPGVRGAPFPAHWSSGPAASGLVNALEPRLVSAPKLSLAARLGAAADLPPNERAHELRQLVGMTVTRASYLAIHDPRDRRDVDTGELTLADYAATLGHAALKHIDEAKRQCQDLLEQLAAEANLLGAAALDQARDAAVDLGGPVPEAFSRRAGPPPLAQVLARLVAHLEDDMEQLEITAPASSDAKSPQSQSSRRLRLSERAAATAETEATRVARAARERRERTPTRIMENLADFAEIVETSNGTAALADVWEAMSDQDRASLAESFRSGPLNGLTHGLERHRRAPMFELAANRARLNALLFALTALREHALGNQEVAPLAVDARLAGPMQDKFNFLLPSVRLERPDLAGLQLALERADLMNVTTEPATAQGIPVRELARHIGAPRPDESAHEPDADTGVDASFAEQLRALHGVIGERLFVRGREVPRGEDGAPLPAATAAARKSKTLAYSSARHLIETLVALNRGKPILRASQSLNAGLAQLGLAQVDQVHGLLRVHGVAGAGRLLEPQPGAGGDTFLSIQPREGGGLMVQATLTRQPLGFAPHDGPAIRLDPKRSRVTVTTTFAYDANGSASVENAEFGYHLAPIERP